MKTREKAITLFNIIFWPVLLVIFVMMWILVKLDNAVRKADIG